ncbi:MAG: hypothetical protein EHM33_09985 [Chloroflexi bacterium]|nr:MAG: hypothetical protein EHM33_09985 [Chloroflexota bacterium]
MSTQAKVAHRKENFFERSAWVFFLVIGVLEILFGWGDMIAGVENDPAILISITGRTPAELKAQDPVLYAAMDHQQKVIGQILWITGALIFIISLTAFRHGARWAWFTFWLIPVSMALGAVSSYNIRLPGESLVPPFYSASLFTILTVLWLALSSRKYVSNGDRG